MQIAAVAQRAGEALLALFFPPHCASCGENTPAGVHLCPRCAASARRIVPPFCAKCSESFAGAIDGAFTCANCAGRVLHFDCAVAPYLSRDVVRDFIHRFKYDHEQFLRQPLAAWLAEALADARLQQPPVEFLVPVPLHPTRLRERGFNQAELLATLLSRHAGVPVLDCLQRVRYTTTQTRLDREERMENLRDAFRVRQSSPVQSRHLVIVDDVFTTGSTVDECARVLRRAGAASVRVITVARG